MHVCVVCLYMRVCVYMCMDINVGICMCMSIHDCASQLVVIYLWFIYLDFKVWLVFVLLFILKFSCTYKIYIRIYINWLFYYLAEAKQARKGFSASARYYLFSYITLRTFVFYYNHIVSSYVPIYCYVLLDIMRK